MSKTEQRFFKLASSFSKQSTYPRVHIGAVIVMGRRVISHGANHWRTHTKQKKYASYRYECPECVRDEAGHIHAEMDAIIRAGKKNLQGSSIFVYREDLKGEIADCKPCGACMRAIKDAGIKRVYYTSRDGYNKLELVYKD